MVNLFLQPLRPRPPHPHLLSPWPPATTGWLPLTGRPLITTLPCLRLPQLRRRQLWAGPRPCTAITPRPLLQQLATLGPRQPRPACMRPHWVTTLMSLQPTGPSSGTCTDTRLPQLDRDLLRALSNTRQASIKFSYRKKPTYYCYSNHLS